MHSQTLCLYLDAKVLPLELLEYFFCVLFYFFILFVNLNFIVNLFSPYLLTIFCHVFLFHFGQLAV